MKEIKVQFVLLLVVLGFFSCGESRWDVPDSSSEVELDFARFELDLFDFAEDGEISRVEVDELNKKYPNLFPLFTEGVMKFGAAKSPQTLVELNKFIGNNDIRQLYQSIEKKYPKNSLQSEVNQLEEGFKRFHYFFPQLAVPKVKTFFSAFNYSTITDDSLLAIGLDNYLGGDFEIYPQIGIPEYKFEKFDREFMVTDAMKAWLTTEFEESGTKNMLEQMIAQGKIIYLLEVFFPKLPPHQKFNYVEEELTWCEKNEGDIWFHLVDMELLYTNESFKIRKYLGDAPFISGFPEGSPGRVGQWVGYKIVKSYVENHPEMELNELMKEENAAQLLQQSKYKPKR